MHLSLQKKQHVFLPIFSSVIIVYVHGSIWKWLLGFSSYSAWAMPHVQQAGRPAWRTGKNIDFLANIAILEPVGPGLVSGPLARPSFASLAWLSGAGAWRICLTEVLFLMGRMCWHNISTLKHLTLFFARKPRVAQKSNPRIHGDLWIGFLNHLTPKLNPEGPKKAILEST